MDGPTEAQSIVLWIATVVIGCITIVLVWRQRELDGEALQQYQERLEKRQALGVTKTPPRFKYRGFIVPVGNYVFMFPLTSLVAMACAGVILASIFANLFR